MNPSSPPSGAAGHFSLQRLAAPYQKPDTWRSLWQVLNSVVGYALLWLVMYWSLSVSYGLTLGLAVLAAGLLIRTFIIFHDCGHGSFFRSKKANDVVGFVTGIITFTPYDKWRREHAVHHATSGDLDRRGIGGDVWTMTVEEYLDAPWRTRWAYRLYRNPLVMLLLGPSFLFLVRNRFTSRSARRREQLNVYVTNLAVAGLVTLLIATMGVKEYLMIQLPIVLLGGAIAVWMFYVQHQFEEVYWERHDDWEYFPAAIEGSSFYKLPRVLHWYTGNIGYHHIHHLSPRIPNYFLRRCHEENPEVSAAAPPITLRTSLRSLAFRLWDEKGRRMVGFGQLDRYRRSDDL
jgi:omega-6 fatty acid desaturase (delta-12 desaturase)